MDIHALPRRDLQALCKRNGIRANMTNAAMADALAALPAVDGIEEYAKPPVAEPTPVPMAAVPAVAAEEEEGEGEMQGISLPGGRGVALTPPEVIVVGEGEEEDEDLIPALGVGRRRASRRPRVEPVDVPATRKRAAASIAETAADAVPGRTTRARSQRVVVPAPEEETLEPRWTPRRAVARKTNTEKEEEEEKGAQGDASDDCAVDSSVQERQADVQCEASEEIHPASEDTKTVPVISGEAAEEVDFTSGAAEENEVPTSGSAAKAIEEKEPVAAPARTTRKRAAANMAELATEAVPTRTTRARSQRVVVSAPEEEAPKARRMSGRAVARKTSTEQKEEEKGMQGDVSDDCVVDSSVQERQADVHEFRDSPVFRNDTVSSEEIHHASEDTEMVAVKEVPLAMLSDEARKEVDFTSGASEEKDVPTSGEKLQSAAKAIEEKEPVAAPATTTRKRAEASMAKIATEAVPARTTRAQSQRVVVSAPEEEAPKGRRMSRRAVARKTGTEQEEEEKGMQGDVADDCVIDSSVQERQVDVQDSPVFRYDIVSSEEIHHATEDTEMAAVKEVPLATLKSDEAAKEVDFTSGASEEKEVPSGEKLQGAAKAIEEKGPVATPATTTRKRVAEAVPARTTRARSQRVVVSAPEEEAPKARRTSRRAVARKTSTEQEEEEKETQGDISHDCEVDSSVQELQADVQKSQDSPNFRNDTVSSEEIHLSCEDTEMVPANEVPLAMLKSGEAAEEVDFTSGANEENEVPTCGEMLQSAANAIEEKEDMAGVEEEAVVATDEMSQRSATVEDRVIEVVTIDNLSQATVTDDEGAVKESGFSCDITGLSVQEKVVVAANCMPQGLAKLDKSVDQVVTINNLSQTTLIDDEGAVKESGFSCNLADVSVEEDGVVAAEEMSQRSAILDESVKEEVATVENLSQATVTEDVATIENLSQATVTEDVATIENLSQATVTDDEWVVKENAFASDLPAVVDTARDFSDHIASSLSAGMREIATKSLSINSITESVAVERVKEVKENKECEALGSLSLRKLKMKLKEKVSVEREKEDKELAVVVRRTLPNPWEWNERRK
ncbi:hypothetical protein ACQ4PT_007604 [Festuca glaucescens]